MNNIQEMIDGLEAYRLKFVNHYNRLSTDDKKRNFKDYQTIDDNFNELIISLTLLLISETQATVKKPEA